MIKVYYAPPSIYTRKVLSVLDEKGLDYQIEKISLENKDHQSEAFFKLNPNGEIPVLTDDAFTVYESTAIIEYLNDEYPEPPLMPEDSEGRARARMIEDFCDLHLFPAVKTCQRKKAANEEPDDDDRAELSAALDRLAGYLGKQSFIAGKLSLADCAVMAACASLEQYGLENLVSSPSLKNYFTVLKTRPGYKGASLFAFEPTQHESTVNP